MNIDKSHKLICPLCGAEKTIPSIDYGCVIETKSWSDGYVKAPKWFEPYPIQKCPECKDFYPLSRAEMIIREDGCTDDEEEDDEDYDNQEADNGIVYIIGALICLLFCKLYIATLGSDKISYRDFRKAIRQFSSWDLSDEERYTIYLSFIWSYNDHHKGRYWNLIPRSRKRPEEPDWAMEFVSDHTTDIVLKAELLRESSEFNKCIRYIKNVITHCSPIQEDMLRKIAVRAIRRNTKVFRL